MEKPRFQDAQVGDAVYCRLHGIGIIIDIDKRSKNYPIVVRHTGGDACTYTYDGSADTSYEEPVLFYRKGSEKYLTERPSPEFEVDWAKVPMGTKVFVSDGELANPQNAVSFFGYFPNLEKLFWIFIGMTEEHAEGFKHCKLAEPCKPEWRK